MATPAPTPAALITDHDLEPDECPWLYNVDTRPTTEYKAPWLWQDAPSRKGETLGKWLVFKSASKIDETWSVVKDAVASGELGATGCKVSTNKKDDTATKKDPSFVICVYTTAKDMDEVGMKLIQLPVVRQTIRYKTDEATLSGKYTCHGHGKVSCRVLYWNKGHPTFGD